MDGLGGYYLDQLISIKIIKSEIIIYLVFFDVLLQEVYSIIYREILLNKYCKILNVFKKKKSLNLIKFLIII